jgi:hypothetical protein
MAGAAGYVDAGERVDGASKLKGLTRMNTDGTDQKRKPDSSALLRNEKQLFYPFLSE